MQLKQYTRYQLDFTSKWTAACGVLMGMSFFLRIVYYFGLMSLRDVGIIELLTSAIIGILLCGGMVIYLSCLHRNAPGLYAMAGAVHCLMLMILSFTSGSAVQIIIACIWYLLAAGVLLITAGGYLPGRLLAAFMFFIPIFVRFFFYDLGKLGLIAWFRELAVLSVLAALGCFAMGLKASKQ